MLGYGHPQLPTPSHPHCSLTPLRWFQQADLHRWQDLCRRPRRWKVVQGEEVLVDLCLSIIDSSIWIDGVIKELIESYS